MKNVKNAHHKFPFLKTTSLMFYVIHQHIYNRRQHMITPCESVCCPICRFLMKTKKTPLFFWTHNERVIVTPWLASAMQW